MDDVQATRRGNLEEIAAALLLAPDDPFYTVEVERITRFEAELARFISVGLDPENMVYTFTFADDPAQLGYGDAEAYDLDTGARFELVTTTSLGERIPDRPPVELPETIRVVENYSFGQAEYVTRQENGVWVKRRTFTLSPEANTETLDRRQRRLLEPREWTLSLLEAADEYATELAQIETGAQSAV